MHYQWTVKEVEWDYSRQMFKLIGIDIGAVIPPVSGPFEDKNMAMADANSHGWLPEQVIINIAYPPILSSPG